MTQRDIKSKIDKLWLDFHSGGITNPMTVIEQLSYLIFSRLLDIYETRNEKKSRRTGKDFNHIFAPEEQHLRWSEFRILGAEEMLPLMRDEVFPHFSRVKEYGHFMRNAQLMIQKPELLVQAVEVITELPLTSGDHKGDLYEYLLSKLSTAGIAGQFRTPRHIIRKMVEILDPKPFETVCDPACGTAGFLVETLSYVMEQYTSEDGVIVGEEEDDKIFTGDLLKPEERTNLTNGFLSGFDFDSTMLRVSAMNLLLHGVEKPHIHYQDTLAATFVERMPEKRTEAFDVILANPPFKGSLDYDTVDPKLIKKVKTKKTELLFIQLILQMLKMGGRAAVIVPDGVLFGSSKAHKAIREALVEENQLEAMISLPSGVFKPYAGVSTGILVFSKGGETEDVFFYNVESDGYSLDDKRDKIEANDLPGMIEAWKNKDPEKDTDVTQKAFFVSADEIRKNNYDLSITRYHEEPYVEEVYEEPSVILGQLKKLENEIMDDLNDLEAMLNE
ncbi:class I SAM-dependent DNA methyltransferase [Maridesulfovibrio sp.]|uniref:class I SAM-dependent DNA methyltransferase n=1 Tax=Maridesulfovibrio sp. TaxID=2795000 RepID=UPI0029CA351F|nr:class I SAM-dependent DNA methyltransferase [Maridesulfovibrio sp.]